MSKFQLCFAPKLEFSSVKFRDIILTHRRPMVLQNALCRDIFLYLSQKNIDYQYVTCGQIQEFVPTECVLQHHLDVISRSSIKTVLQNSLEIP